MQDYDMTNGEQIDNYAKKYFPKQYKGLVVDIDSNNIKQLPPLQNNQFYINNKDLHWTAFIKTKGKLHEFDSYNRDLIKQLPELKVSSIQGGNGIDDQSCGQRTLAFLHTLFN